MKILLVGIMTAVAMFLQIVSCNLSTPIYSASDKEGVSLMFNVYENTENVEKILQILEENNVKATFFVGGIWAKKNVETINKIVYLGHTLGNHGYVHKDHSKLSYEGNEKEITLCDEIVLLAGHKMKYFAPPSGAFNKDTLSACQKLGYKVIMWSRDTIDWRDKNADVIYSRAIKVKNGDFVLMHPTNMTVVALNRVITYYKNNGFSLKTIDEMM